MKRWILVVMALGAVAALGYYVNRPKAPLLAEIEPVTAASADRTIGVAPHPIAVAPVAQQIIQRPVDPPPPTQAALAARKEAGLKLVFNQAIETLLSPQASYDQKKAVWKQLKATGKLDEAVAELEQRVASDPNSADAATALGEGYYKEAGQTDDVREKAMLAMKADQTLEAALNLDPSSWDARFTKTVGMSYWPPGAEQGPGSDRSIPGPDPAAGRGAAAASVCGFVPPPRRSIPESREPRLRQPGLAAGGGPFSR